MEPSSSRPALFQRSMACHDEPVHCTIPCSREIWYCLDIFPNITKGEKSSGQDFTKRMSLSKNELARPCAETSSTATFLAPALAELLKGSRPAVRGMGNNSSSSTGGAISVSKVTWPPQLQPPPGISLVRSWALGLVPARATSFQA